MTPADIRHLADETEAESERVGVDVGADIRPAQLRALADHVEWLTRERKDLGGFVDRIREYVMANNLGVGAQRVDEVLIAAYEEARSTLADIGLAIASYGGDGSEPSAQAIHEIVDRRLADLQRENHELGVRAQGAEQQLAEARAREWPCRSGHHACCDPTFPDFTRCPTCGGDPSAFCCSCAALAGAPGQEER